MPASERGRLFLKVLFSLWILYHCIVVIVMPNGSSFMGRHLEPYMRAYASVLGMNTTWNFFSPDPAHLMYIKFTVSFEGANGEPARPPLEIFMPEQKEQGVWDLAEKRTLYAMRYMLLDPRRLELILGPWMCRQYPGASHVLIEHMIHPIPRLEDAAMFRSQEITDMAEEYNYLRQEYRCSQINDEVSS